MGKNRNCYCPWGKNLFRIIEFWKALESMIIRRLNFMASSLQIARNHRFFDLLTKSVEKMLCNYFRLTPKAEKPKIKRIKLKKSQRNM